MKHENSCVSARDSRGFQYRGHALGDLTLKHKLITFYVGEKDGESHNVGVTVAPDGTLGTKDFYDKTDANGKGTGHSTYHFPNGSIVTNYTTTVTGKSTPAAMLSENTRSFPERAPTRAPPGQADLGRLGRQESAQRRWALRR